jgi:hypothetical protein
LRWGRTYRMVAIDSTASSSTRPGRMPR